MDFSDKWIKKYARAGMFSKGVVYALIGGLTTFAAFTAGGQKADKGGAFQFVLGQPFGKVLLALIGLGLIGYVAWRFIQATKDPEDEGNMRRIGYASSGAFYALIAFTAIEMVFSGGESSSSSGKQTQLLSGLLDHTAGQIVVGGFALIFFGKSLWQFYRALSGKFKSKLNDIEMDEKARKAILNTGMIGYISRGIVIGIVGYFFLQAAWQSNSAHAGGTKEAFSVLQSSVAGPLLLGIVSLGLFGYGVFMMVKAHYRVLPSL